MARSGTRRWAAPAEHIVAEPGGAAYMPVRDPPQGRPEEGVETIGDKAARRRVLIVEDDGAIGFVLHEMMVECGFEVAGLAADLPAALRGARQAALDMAVLDVNLGGVQTWPVADALAARGVPFMFITGDDGEDIPTAWRHVPRLQKPFRHADLLARLTRMLGEMPG